MHDRFAMSAAILGIVSAAFSIWLAVQFFSRRRKRAVLSMCAAILGLALYVLSFGPACWISSRAEAAADFLPAAYAPLLGCISDNCDTPLCYAVFRFAQIGAAPGWEWTETYVKLDDGGRDHSWVWGQASENW